MMLSQSAAPPPEYPDGELEDAESSAGSSDAHEKLPPSVLITQQVMPPRGSAAAAAVGCPGGRAGPGGRAKDRGGHAAADLLPRTRARGSRLIGGPHTPHTSQPSALTEHAPRERSPLPCTPSGEATQSEQTSRPPSKRAVVKVDRVLRCGARSHPPTPLARRTRRGKAPRRMRSRPAPFVRIAGAQPSRAHHPHPRGVPSTPPVWVVAALRSMGRPRRLRLHGRHPTHATPHGDCTRPHSPTGPRKQAAAPEGHGPTPHAASMPPRRCVRGVQEG